MSIRSAKPTPILVIGMNRTGTKWLSNELARHLEIVCVQDPRHYGILETNLFQVFPAKFDLNQREDYIALLALWTQTDFFRRSGISKTLFDPEAPLPVSCLDLFERLMDDLARRHGAAYWLQKAPPLVAFDLLDQFPEAHVVFIRRGLIDTVRTHAKRARAQGEQASLARLTFRYIAQVRIIEHLHRKGRGVLVEYEDLKRSKNEVLTRLLQTWGMKVELAEAGENLRRNTAFNDEGEREAFFSRLDRVNIRFWAFLMRLLPLPLIRTLYRKSSTEVSFLPGSFVQTREGWTEQDLPHPVFEES